MMCKRGHIAGLSAFPATSNSLYLIALITDFECICPVFMVTKFYFFYLSFFAPNSANVRDLSPN